MPIQESTFFVDKVGKIISAIVEKYEIGVTNADAMLADKIHYDQRTVFNWRKGYAFPADVPDTIKLLERGARELGLEETADIPMEGNIMDTEKPVDLFNLGVLIGEMKSQIQKLERDVEQLKRRDTAISLAYKESANN